MVANYLLTGMILQVNAFFLDETFGPWKRTHPDLEVATRRRGTGRSTVDESWFHINWRLLLLLLVVVLLLSSLWYTIIIMFLAVVILACEGYFRVLSFNTSEQIDIGLAGRNIFSQIGLNIKTNICWNHHLLYFLGHKERDLVPKLRSGTIQSYVSVKNRIESTKRDDSKVFASTWKT